MPFAMGGHVATAFRAGRVFLVGDAAHRTTPACGIGMNIAIHGAHNLGWKLAWVLRGWAGEVLLDSYEAERRPIGTENVLRSLGKGRTVDGDGLAWDIGVRYTSAVIDSGDRTPGSACMGAVRRVPDLDA
jgi:2-polyprenyl-6-methoxyphenol hydroxylase-like FAD-dependent oxidoreductase